MKRILALAVVGLLACSRAAAGEQALPNTRWHVANGSDTVVVFVHGILSNSTSCWTAGNGTYWPDLVRQDPRFEGPDIYLGGYYTEAASGAYRVADAADTLFSYMTTPDANGRAPVMSKPHLLFVAHSTGGLVVREMLLRKREAFEAKTVGLALMASPSRGSDWADRLESLRRMAGNKMAADLSTDSSYTQQLDRQFAELVKNGAIPRLVGVDAFENKFIVPRWWWWDAQNVVTAEKSGTYFGWYKIVAGTDHFSIVKPDSRDHAAHQVLVDFFINDFKRARTRTVTTEPIKRWGLPASTTGRKLYQARIRPAGLELDEMVFNDQWAQAVQHSVFKVLSDTLSYPPDELRFEGAIPFPRDDPKDVEALADAGRDLNALAVTLTAAQMNQSGSELVTTTYFRSVNASTTGATFQYPPIQDSVPTARFGPAMQALNKYWGYYVLVALAERCLTVQKDKPGCDRPKVTEALQRALRGLGSNDRVLIEEISRLIATSRGTS